MPSLAQATIDGVPCTLEPLPDGSIRVAYESQQFNPFHGRGTDCGVSYIVHPAQRYQHEHLNSLLPADRRIAANPAGEARPWWSYTGAAKEKREKDDAGE